MGRKYSVAAEFAGVQPGSIDLFEMDAPADKVWVLHSVSVGQITLAGEADAAMGAFLLIRGATTSGSGGSTATPKPLDAGDAAAGGTFEVANTTAATGGTDVLHREAFNIQSGFNYLPTPEARIVVSDERLVGLMTLPNLGSNPTLELTVVFEELG